MARRLRFKAWRKSPALTQETTPSQRRITRLLNDAQKAAASEVDGMLPQIADALSRGQVDRVVSMMPTEPWLEAQDALAEELLGELLDAGSRVSLPTIRKEELKFSFDRERPESVTWARRESGQMIREITEDQRKVVRGIITQATDRQYDWADAARQVRGTVGLTETQAGWVRNHYDRAFADAISGGASPSAAADLAGKSAARYQTSIHRYRAETIARTETMRAASEGRREAWDQGLAQGYIDPLWQKEWIAEADACPICQAQDGIRIGLRDSFGPGEPPAHPNCRCDVLLIPEAAPEAQGSPAVIPEPGLPEAPQAAPLPSWEGMAERDLVDSLSDLAAAKIRNSDDYEIISKWVDGDMTDIQFAMRLEAGDLDALPRGMKDDVLALANTSVRLPEDATLYRVVPYDSLKRADFQVGDVMWDDAFATTAVKRSDYEWFREVGGPLGDGSSDFTLEIRASAGTEGVWCLPRGIPADYNSFEEFILMPGQKMTVVEVTEDKVIVTIP